MKLEGKPTSTHGGEDFKKIWKPILRQIGRYPGKKFNKLDSGSAPKQTTRLLKVACNDCGLTMRITKKWIEETDGDLCCPNGGCRSTDLAVG